MSEGLEPFLCDFCKEIKYGDECCRDFKKCKECMEKDEERNQE